MEIAVLVMMDILFKAYNVFNVLLLDVNQQTLQLFQMFVHVQNVNLLIISMVFNVYLVQLQIVQFVLRIHVQLVFQVFIGLLEFAM